MCNATQGSSCTDLSSATGKFNVTSLSKHCWTLPEITLWMRYSNLLVCGSFGMQDSSPVVDERNFLPVRAGDAPPLLLNDTVHACLLTDTVPTALSKRVHQLHWAWTNSEKVSPSHRISCSLLLDPWGGVRKPVASSVFHCFWCRVEKLPCGKFFPSS